MSQNRPGVFSSLRMGGKRLEVTGDGIGEMTN